MPRLRPSEWLGSLAVAGASLTLFAAFFFVWVIAPFTVVLLFVAVLVLAQERFALGGRLRGRVRERRERLEREARARREALREGS